ncbi:L-aspartate oxidase [Pajaroellobacter abortibovis]|uniref:L-aspartate oxidase n=1 Tax=Pajaroellobacter abortibovis TaxID=1882918 RepID=A0A1L6MVT3_9BACT|nr:L-aspartate oxidase [Pajaroellobacter abortibovis]APR99621.1 L-aspartate oxidase [Pajaroellobacter abortibovis]
MQLSCDYLIIGSGIAGLLLALEVVDYGDVIVVTKTVRDESNTKYAQGGIGAVISSEDSFESHIQDTLIAGGNLCKPEVVSMCVREGPSCIARLQKFGVQFDMESSSRGGPLELDLHLEGGHSHRRIVHRGDATGRELINALLEAADDNPRIRMLEKHMAVDLLLSKMESGTSLCVGAYVLDIKNKKVITIRSNATILATGGSGKVYLYTSNPDIATGDGVAMAYRAGAEVANMEFYQFHPTCLFHPQARNFLVSEVMRGEGAILRGVDGIPFMKKYHPLGELAPRDIVARAIDFEMKRTGAECVLLDITQKKPSFLRERFPMIHAECLKLGIDITVQPIPVVPAAHYQCGGIVTDVNGETSLPGLWAIGECACTGFHGANRLASNSLLEGAVFASRVARVLKGREKRKMRGSIPDWEVGQATVSDEAVVITQDWDELRRFMWNYVGIVRSTQRLQRALRRIDLLWEEIQEYYWNYVVTRNLLELRNIAIVARLMVEAALSRRESRGIHYLVDFPSVQKNYEGDTILRKGSSPFLRKL